MSSDDQEVVLCDKIFHEHASTNGSIDLTGFTKLIHGLFNAPCEEEKPSASFDDQIAQVFDTFDSNKDDLIDKDEFELMWFEWLSTVLFPRSALLIVDVQNDFITGSLAMEKFTTGQQCHRIIPIINSLVEESKFRMVVYTFDWHPENHISFVDNVHSRKVVRLNGVPIEESKMSQTTFKPFDHVRFNISGVERDQIVYPKHCCQSTWGSALPDDLIVPKEAIKIYKGVDPDVDSYSAFKDNEGLSWTQLDKLLRDKGITDLYICGLAYDICIYHTSLDALALNYRTILVDDCCKGTNEIQVNHVRSELRNKGCMIINSSQVNSIVTGKYKPWPLAYQMIINFRKLCCELKK